MYLITETQLSAYSEIEHEISILGSLYTISWDVKPSSIYHEDGGNRFF
jgi:hypothetical protein